MLRWRAPFRRKSRFFTTYRRHCRTTFFLCRAFVRRTSAKKCAGPLSPQAKKKNGVPFAAGEFSLEFFFCVPSGLDAHVEYIDAYMVEKTAPGGPPGDPAGGRTTASGSWCAGRLFYVLISACDIHKTPTRYNIPAFFTGHKPFRGSDLEATRSRRAGRGGVQNLMGRITFTRSDPRKAIRRVKNPVMPPRLPSHNLS